MRLLDLRLPRRPLLGVLAVALALVAGCGLDTRNIPEQFLVASVDGDRGATNAAVTVLRSTLADRRNWTSAALFTGAGPIDTINGPPFGGTAIWGRGGGSPGIGSNGAFNVLAFWGRTSAQPIDAGTVTMYVATSQDGVAWTWPVPVHSTTAVDSNSQGIRRSAGISVASRGLNGPWFAAYADETGSILVVPLPIDSAGAIISGFDTTPTTIAGAATDVAPALSHFGPDLLLAWRDPTAGGPIRLLRTSDGRAWPNTAGAAVALEGGSPLSSEISAPFLHSIFGDIFLTTTAVQPTGSPNVAGRVRVLQSGDGVNFSEVVSFPVADPFLEGPAAAGSAGELVVVYPRAVRGTTTLWAPGLPERTLPTSTNRRVTIALGAN